MEQFVHFFLPKGVPRKRNETFAAYGLSMASSAALSEDVYATELEKAEISDLSSVEDRGIVTVCTTNDGSDGLDRLLQDDDGNRVVILVPGNVPGEKDSWEKSFHLFLRETAEVSHA